MCPTHAVPRRRPPAAALRHRRPGRRRPRRRHNLDRLRVEGAPLFARTTGWWRARRKTLAEEQHWRTSRPGRWRQAGGIPRSVPASGIPQSRGAGVEPVRLAALYRELRKGREDAKDEPGAADFYYGVCEMRRHDPTTFRAERPVLWLYWLVSGYALRAWRAVLARALLIVAGAVILAGIGCKPPVSPQIVRVGASHGQAVYETKDVARLSSREQLPEALAFSAESTASLLRAPDRALTLPGRWVAGLRLGPGMPPCLQHADLSLVLGQQLAGELADLRHAAIPGLGGGELASSVVPGRHHLDEGQVERGPVEPRQPLQVAPP